MSSPSFFATSLRTVVAVAVAASSPLWAQIALSCSQTSLHAGEHCVFTAAHADGEPGAWAWMVLETDGGSLLPGEGGKAEYTAPKVAVPRTFHIQVWEDVHPPQVAILELKVLPGAEAAAKDPEGKAWMTPKLEIYAGDPDPSPDARTARFNGIRKICYLDDPALPGHLNHHWVVADGYGVQLVSARGEVRPWLGGRERPATGHELPPDLADPEAFLCASLAARPQGSAETNPLHLVFCEVALHPHYTCRIYSLEPGGGRRLLGGGPGVGYQDGPALEARFGTIGDLTLDREGNVFILDRGNAMVRKLSLDGKVTTLAGHRATGTPECRDGKGREAGFQDPSGMTWDPLTGDLYVSDGNAIRKVTQGGEVTTLLGTGSTPGRPGGFALPSEDPLVQVPASTNCLYRPEGLAIQGRNLFIADSANCAVRVLDLDLGTLHTMAGNPIEQRTRRGPLAFYSPGRTPAECAAVASPQCVSFSTEGTCLVGTPECVVALDMPPFLSPARLARRGLPEDRKEEGLDHPAGAAPASSPAPPPTTLAVLLPAGQGLGQPHGSLVSQALAQGPVPPPVPASGPVATRTAGTAIPLPEGHPAP